MTPKYKIGQKVIIKSVKNQHLSPRDSDIGAYAGKSGKVTGYYSISLNRGVFYLYTVRTETSYKDVVLHEDELEACMA